MHVHMMSSSLPLTHGFSSSTLLIPNHLWISSKRSNNIDSGSLPSRCFCKSKRSILRKAVYDEWSATEAFVKFQRDAIMVTTNIMVAGFRKLLRYEALPLSKYGPANSSGIWCIAGSFPCGWFFVIFLHQYHPVAVIESIYSPNLLVNNSDVYVYLKSRQSYVNYARRKKIN